MNNRASSLARLRYIWIFVIGRWPKLRVMSPQEGRPTRDLWNAIHHSDVSVDGFFFEEHHCRTLLVAHKITQKLPLAQQISQYHHALLLSSHLRCFGSIGLYYWSFSSTSSSIILTVTDGFALFAGSERNAVLCQIPLGSVCLFPFIEYLCMSGDAHA